MRRNTEPTEEISVLRLHPSHDNLHGQYPLCSVCEEGGNKVSRVLVVVPAKLDVSQGGLTLLPHVMQVRPQALHFYPGDNQELAKLTVEITNVGSCTVKFLKTKQFNL